VKHGHVLGLPAVAISRSETCSQLERWIAERQREFVVLANVHVIETARRDAELADALCQAGLVLPDGAPIAWAVGRDTGTRSERVTGCDVFEELCRRSETAGYRHFFYGSTPETVELLRQRVSERYPGIRICGTLSPPFGPVELREEELAAINAARPDIVWVGLGAPKQELWMSLAREHLEAPLLLGVGAVFDFASGRKPRAPRVMQRLWLEWLHRLITEPRRLARRYASTNTTFLVAMLRSAARRTAVRYLDLGPFAGRVPFRRRRPRPGPPSTRRGTPSPDQALSSDRLTTTRRPA
jgi:N-acetylglucosaminyldiphosphoundecaprenol N-acetyl-beta-D-mannosaminyltransferase